MKPRFKIKFRRNNQANERTRDGKSIEYIIRSDKVYTMKKKQRVRRIVHVQNVTSSLIKQQTATCTFIQFFR